MPKEITLSGDIGFEVTARELDIELKKAAGADVLLLVNSRGGFVFEGIEMFNLIRAYKGHTEARIVGLAASAASYVILAAEKVTAFDNAAFFIHNALAIVIGNHNDMRKRADELEGLSSMLAKAYVNKSGKTAKEIEALMDAETIFFADEILEAGFVDEIIESKDVEDATDKASAIIQARASMTICINRMRASDAANEDYQKAVAYMDSMKLLGDSDTDNTAVADDDINSNSNDTTPAGAGNKKQEDKQLKTLAELLAENPSAKAEHDKLIAKARTEGATGAKDEMKEVIERVAPILKSSDYSEAVKACGVKAITGEGTVAAFEAVVVMADETIEKAKAEAAKKETDSTKETPGASGKKLTDAEAEAEFKKKKDDVKAQGGF